MKWGEQKNKNKQLMPSVAYTQARTKYGKGGQANKISKTLLWFETDSGSYLFAFYFIKKIN